jgi:hypothetical protein
MHVITRTQGLRRVAPPMLLLAAVVACSDTAPPASPEAPPTDAAPRFADTDTITDVHRQALADLTRAVALALNDGALRQRIKDDMRAAPFAEHKLEFGHYVRSRPGGVLLAKMATVMGRGAEQLRVQLDGLPELEFYMPVREHRESWRGGADLIVAGSLESDDEGRPVIAPVAFNLQGEPVALSADATPATPTLVIVRREADFSRPMDIMRAKNINDRGGTAIGTLIPSMIEPCLEPLKAISFSCGGGGGGYVPPPPASNDPAPGTPASQQRGISIEEMITHMRTFNDHEPWWKGAPEFYLLLAGRLQNGDSVARRIGIPEGPWSGSDDGSNRKWHYFGEIPLFTWDADLGTRVKIQCFESDLAFNATFTVTGDTRFPRDSNRLGQISARFQIGGNWTDTDDNCQSAYIDLQNTLQQWYWIPDGKEDDGTYPVPPYRNGTGELEWYGVGYKRVL